MHEVNAGLLSLMDHMLVRRVAAILKVGGSWIAGIEVDTLGMVGGMAYGCLDFNNLNIVSLFGAMSWDIKIRQAFENSTSSAYAIADASFFLSVSGSERR